MVLLEFWLGGVVERGCFDQGRRRPGSGGGISRGRVTFLSRGGGTSRCGYRRDGGGQRFCGEGGI